MICNNCIHYEMCGYEKDESLTFCAYFRDKTLITALPCKVGADVFFPLTPNMYHTTFDLLKFNEVNVGKVICFLLTKKGVNIRVQFREHGYTEMTFYNDEINKMVFFDKSVAIKRLEELKKLDKK